MHLSEAAAGLAARAASRRRHSRCQRAASRDAGKCPAPGERIRFPAFPPRLLSVLPLLAAADALSHHAAWAPRSARAAARLLHVHVRAGGLDLQLAAASDTAGAL